MAAKTNCEKNGIKYYRVTTTVGKTPDGKLIRKEFYGKSKSDAESKRDEYLKGINAGLSLDYREMQMGQFMKTWLFEIVRISSAHSTFDRYEGIFRNYVQPSPLAQLKVYEIKRLTLQRHYNSMFTNGNTNSQIFNLNKLLKTFFNYAIAEGYITTNPCFKAIIPKSKEILEGNEEEIDPFTDKEIQMIFQHTYPEYRMLYQLCLGTGLRKGELLALTLNDINFERQEVKINKTLQLVKIIEQDGSHKYATIVKPPKTKNSNRIVPIPEKLMAQLQKHVLKQKEKFLKKGLAFADTDLIFTTENCNHIDGACLLKSWQRTLTRAGVRYRNFHNLRHTYATKLFEQGVNIKTVQMLLGHANMGITADIYTHVVPKEKNNAAQTLNYLFKS